MRAANPLPGGPLQLSLRLAHLQNSAVLLIANQTDPRLLSAILLSHQDLALLKLHLNTAGRFELTHQLSKFSLQATCQAVLQITLELKVTKKNQSIQN